MLRGLPALLELLSRVGAAARARQEARRQSRSRSPLPGTRWTGGRARSRSASPERRGHSPDGRGGGYAEAAVGGGGFAAALSSASAAVAPPLHWLLDLIARSYRSVGDVTAVEVGIAGKHSAARGYWSLQKPLAARQVARRSAALVNVEEMLGTLVL